MAASLTATTNRIEDAELLYRAARPTHITARAGRVRVSSNVFSDRTEQISVDRARLQSNDPRPTMSRLPEADAVVSLTAGEARSASPITRILRDVGGRIQVDEQGQEKMASSEIEVVADALPGNAAHALIRGTPEFEHKKMFKLLIEHLALKAKIEISPPDLLASE